MPIDSDTRLLELVGIENYDEHQARGSDIELMPYFHALALEKYQNPLLSNDAKQNKLLSHIDALLRSKPKIKMTSLYLLKQEAEF
ncbi:hypothetical protein JCM19233_1940 [Vibrio astriarenae]|nr:hypothetical protein JCM19233_1940 [Vibrio sp. C7]